MSLHLLLLCGVLLLQLLSLLLMLLLNLLAAGIRSFLFGFPAGEERCRDDKNEEGDSGAAL